MDYFRVLILVVFCVCRIHLADAALVDCDNGACTADNTECNGSNKCVCQAGFIEGTGNEANTCVKVLGGSCPASTDCDSVPNSECTTGTPVCKCATGYKEENNLCVASELGDTCETNEDCSTSVPNSECTTGTPVCKCAPGYKEKDKLCVENVLGGACGSDSACTPDNSECNGSDKCVCQAGYIEGTGGKANACVKVLGTCDSSTACTSDNAVCKEPNCVCQDGFKDGTGAEANTCVKVLGGTCKTNSDCDSVVNSECDTESCKCTTGYEEKDSMCVASGSGGPRSIPCVLLMASMAIFRFSFM